MFLDPAIRAGFSIGGTWPMRTERVQGLGGGMDSITSSIVQVCHGRPGDSPLATRRRFVRELKNELPTAHDSVQRGNIDPVHFAEAAIGPGMPLYSRCAKVLDEQGQLLPVRDAPAPINHTLHEVLAEQEGDFDADNRWVLAFFEQSGFDKAGCGVAGTLSKAKNTTVGG